jgi:hypothetical protein
MRRSYFPHADWVCDINFVGAAQSEQTVCADVHSKSALTLAFRFPVNADDIDC